MTAIFLIGLLLCLLTLAFVVVCLDIKAYIVHIALFVLAFIPLLNIVAGLLIAVHLYFAITNGDIALKPTKLNKFLFNKKD